MNKYKWNLYELRQNLNALKALYKEVDDKEKIGVEETIEFYQDMINLSNKKVNEEPSSFAERIPDDNIMDMIADFGWFYRKENLEIINTLLKTLIPIKENYIGDIHNPKIPATNEYLVDITDDFFYHMTPPNIYNDFAKAMTRPNFINFTYTKNNYGYTGIIIEDRYLSKKYINVFRSNELLDLIVLPHEMFHYLFRDRFFGLPDANNYYFLNEIEGCFANILFGKYFADFDTKDITDLFFNIYYVNVFQNQIEELVIRNQVLNSIKNNQIRFKKLNKKINDYEMEKIKNDDELKLYFEIPQESNIKCSLSFLAALDLYYIYLKDSEFAFYLLKNICYHKENDILQLLRRNHITFMDDGYANYKNYVKKLSIEVSKYEKV